MLHNQRSFMHPLDRFAILDHFTQTVLFLAVRIPFSQTALFFCFQFIFFPRFCLSLLSSFAFSLLQICGEYRPIFLNLQYKENESRTREITELKKSRVLKNLGWVTTFVSSYR